MDTIQSRWSNGSKRVDFEEIETIEEPSTAVTSDFDPAVSSFPEGGLWGWLAVVACFSVQFTTSALTYGAGIFISYYSTHMLKGYTVSQISWISSTAPFLHSVVGVPVGKLYDDGYLYHTVIAGSCLYVLAIMLLSVCTKYYQFILTQGILVGIATGLMFQPPFGVIGQYFKKRRALAMGIAAAGSPLGGIVFPITFNTLFERIGFPWGMRIVGFICLIVLSIGLAGMRSRLPLRYKMAKFDEPRPEENAIHLEAAPKLDYKTFFNLSYTAPVVGTGFLMMAVTYPMGYLQIYAQSNKAVSSTLAFYVLPIMMSGAIVGGPFFSWLSDIVGVLNVNIVVVVFLAGFQSSLLGARSPAAVVIIAFLYGFLSNAFQGTLGALFARLSFSVAEMGHRMGFGYFVLGVGALIGSPIQGALLGSPYVWWRPSVFVACSLLVGASLLAVGRQRLCSRLNTRYV